MWWIWESVVALEVPGAGSCLIVEEKHSSNQLLSTHTTHTHSKTKTNTDTLTQHGKQDQLHQGIKFSRGDQESQKKLRGQTQTRVTPHNKHLNPHSQIPLLCSFSFVMEHNKWKSKYRKVELGNQLRAPFWPLSHCPKCPRHPTKCILAPPSTQTKRLCPDP